MNTAKAAGGKKKIAVQLHWSEYLDGEWTAHESSEFHPVLKPASSTGKQGPFSNELIDQAKIATDPVKGGANEPSVPSDDGSLLVSSNYDTGAVHVHVSKEPPDDEGEERGVYIHLRGPESFFHRFTLAGRNSTVESDRLAALLTTPYLNVVEQAARYSYGGPLWVRFSSRITTEANKAPVQNKQPAAILETGNAFTLVPSNSRLELAGSDAGKPDDEIATLLKPVFYQDRAHTLFVEPSVTERTIHEWQEWVTPAPLPDPGLPDWLKDPDLWQKAIVPGKTTATPPLPIDPESRFKVRPGADWLLNRDTVLLYGGEPIGPGGRAGLEIRPPTGDAGAAAEEGVPLNVHAASEIAAGSTVVLTRADTLVKAGLAPTAAGLKIVGRGGLNAGLAQNLTALNRTGTSDAGRDKD
jgi:hypothetical protein